MKQSKSDLRSSLIRYMDWVERRGVSFYIDQGSDWYFNRFLLQLQKFEQIAKSEEELDILSGVYYRIGDVCDFNGAIQTAIKAYKKSIQYSVYPKRESSSWRELMGQLDNIGKYRQAIKAGKKAISLDPEDGLAHSDLEDVIENFKSRTPPYLDETSAIIVANDDLINQKPLIAIERLKKTTDPRNFPTLAAAYAQAGSVSESIKAWKKHINKTDLISLTYSDWFYFTKEINRSIDFWSLLLRTAEEKRFTHGVYSTFPVVDESFKRKGPDDLITLNKQLREHLLIHLAVLKLDKTALLKFNEKYPEIVKVRNALKKV